MTARTSYPQNSSSTTLYSAISSGTNSLPVVDLRVADAIFQAESTNNCYIREGVLIPRFSPKASARVIQSFSIQLFLSEAGYIAVSDLSNISELEQTRGDAIRSYLYSLVDELVWLRQHEESLSKSLREELNRIRAFIRVE